MTDDAKGEAASDEAVGSKGEAADAKGEAADAKGDGEDAKSGGRSFREKFQDFVSEYGMVGIVTWFTIFGLTVVGFALAFQFGLDMGGAVEEGETPSAAAAGGVWLAAYIAAQATKPLRALATFALTPILARTWKKFRGASEDEESKSPSAED